MADHRKDQASKNNAFKKAQKKQHVPSPKGSSQDADRHSKIRHPVSSK